jgi:N-methylhydantoinase A
VQIVNIRIVARIPRDGLRSALPQVATSAKERFGGGKRKAYFGQHCGTLATPILDRLDLARAKRRYGPLLIDEYDATTLVPPGCSARLDGFDNIVIRIGA